MWLDFAFQELFGLEQRLSEETADLYFDTISEKLRTPEFLPRALYERFNLEVLATTDSPLDSLADHQAIRESNWKARILPTFRPDPVVDPEFAGFAENIAKLGEKTGEDTSTWAGYLNALRMTRVRFRELGCTATDHGHPTARTANLSTAEAAELFARVIAGSADAQQQELFRAQMLTEMARMSLEDGLVMQIHPGSARNHNRKLYERYGRDVGADIPMPTNYVDALRPLLDQFGNERDLTIILFTLDESAYSRELAPLAGHYPCLRLGPPWWFHDSPEGMMRFREQVTETAGFYNTVGFNDDTRAFLSIPARHDMSRRMDCAFLAKLVAEHRLEEDEALEVAHDLAYRLGEKGISAVEDAAWRIRRLSTIRRRARLSAGTRLGRVRWTVCAMLFVATSINYMDRQVIAILKPTLEHSIGMTEVSYGYIVDAFQIAYAIGLLAAGRLIDKLGTRIGYMLVMAVWSLSAMGHALASTVLEFGFARFFLGLGESGNFPAAIKTVAEWFPQNERSLATGIFNSGANVGAILAPAIVPWVTLRYGWHAAFLTTGLFSVLWIVWWFRNYRKPTDHSTLTGAELRHIYQEAAADMGPSPSVPWRRLLGFRQTWAFSIAKFLTDPIWWFYLFWLPSYFSAKFNLNLSHLGLPLIIVYNVSAIGSIGGGWLPAPFRRLGLSPNYARLAAMLFCACLVVPIYTAS